MNVRATLRLIANMIQGSRQTTGIIAPMSSTSGPDSGERTYHVLLVEDEPSISGFVRRGLIFEGYDVEVAADGHAALAALRNRPPDVLVLDLLLPGVDGRDNTRRLRPARSEERP